MNHNPPSDARALLPGRTNADVGRRLLLLMHAYGIRKKKDFCDRVRMSQQQLTNVVAGTTSISVSTGLRIKDEFGVNLDWIFEGDRLCLTMEQYELLRGALHTLNSERE